MRRLLITLSLAGSLVAASLGFASSPLRAEHVAPTGVDLAASVSHSPNEVSPVGGIVVYTATASNNSTVDPQVPLPARLVDVTDNGTLDLAGSKNLELCSFDQLENPTITCDVELAFGEAFTIRVAIRTKAEPGTVTNTATVGFTPGAAHDFVDDDHSNDTASQTTQVFDDPNQSSALLHEGESMTFDGHVLTVRTAPHGVIVTMKTAPFNGDTCGATLCDEGLTVDFDTDPYYQGTVGLDTNFGKGAPCRSITNPDCVNELYAAKGTGAERTVTLIPSCATSPSSSPCIEDEYKDTGAQLHQVLFMRSEDPDIKTPLGTISG